MIIWQSIIRNGIYLQNQLRDMSEQRLVSAWPGLHIYIYIYIALDTFVYFLVWISGMEFVRCLGKGVQYTRNTTPPVGCIRRR